MLLNNKNTNMTSVNSKIEKLVADPLNYSKSLSIKELEEVLGYANYKYYNSCRSVMDDDVYDVIRNILEMRKPDSPILKTVGAPIESSDKVKLPYWMGSLDKIKPNSNQLRIYLKKFDGPYVISDKLDGSSGLFHRFKDDGKWVNRFYTRGDGNFGRDISHLLRLILGKDFLKNLPEKEISVRGEIIINRENFKKFEKDKKNPRALTNGIVNCKKVDIHTAKHLDFVVFELLNPKGYKPSDQYKYIKSLGFKTPYYKSYDTINNDSLSKTLLDRRDNSDYIIDGIIIQDNHSYPLNTSGNPDSAVAFKMILMDQLVESIVLDVEWNASRHGILKPVVIYEPVNLGGTTMQRATGFHAQYIKENKLGPGSRIQITRSGDVIPYIVKVISGTEAKLPTDVEYYWRTHDIVLKDASESKGVTVKKLGHFITTLEIKSIGGKTLELFVDNGIDTIKKLITATKEDFLKLDRVAGKSAENMFNNIQNGIKDVPLELIMAASQTFSNGLGKRKFKAILKVHPNILDIKEDMQEVVVRIPGFAKTATDFAEGLPTFKKFLEKHQEITIQKPKVSVKRKMDSKFEGRSFVFTGVRDKELEKIIEENGGNISSAVSKNTHIVVTKDPESNSGKIKKAKQLEIRVVSMDDFRGEYFHDM